MMAEKLQKFTVVTLRDRPGINEIFFKQKQRIWPEIMFRDVYADKLWSYVYTVFEDFQLYLLNEEQKPIAVGQTMPLVWDGQMEDLPVGWADSLVRGTNDYEQATIRIPSRRWKSRSNPNIGAWVSATE